MNQRTLPLMISLLVLLSMSCAFFQRIISPGEPTLAVQVIAPTPSSEIPTAEILIPPAEVEPAPSDTAVPTPEPVSPSATPTLLPTPSPSPQVEEAITIVADWELQYNPTQWEVIVADDSDAIRATTWGQPGLLHRRYPGCLLRVNMGMGVPFDWKKHQENRMFGGLELQVEAWTDGNDKPVLTVYHYPPDNWDHNWRLELVIDENPQACIESAEALIAHSPGPIR